MPHPGRRGPGGRTRPAALPARRPPRPALVRCGSVEPRKGDVEGHRHPRRQQALRPPDRRLIAPRTADMVVNRFRTLDADLHPLHPEIRQRAGPPAVDQGAVAQQEECEPLSAEYFQDGEKVGTQERFAAGDIATAGDVHPVQGRPVVEHRRRLGGGLADFRQRQLPAARAGLVAMPAAQIAALGQMPLEKKLERFVARHRQPAINGRYGRVRGPSRPSLSAVSAIMVLAAGPAAFSFRLFSSFICGMPGRDFPAPPV